MIRHAVQIRPAAPAHAADIAKVHVETWRATYAGLIPDAYLVNMTVTGQTRFWRRQIGSRGRAGPILVAEAAPADGGELIGFASGGALRNATLPYKSEIYTLYVMGDWQGRGVGRALLTSTFQALLRNGLTSAYLWVLSDNPSRFFYEAMGAEKVAERQESFAGTLLDETAYAWADLKAWLAAHA